MIKNFLILTFYIGCISSAYVSERAIDLVANSEIRNDIKVEIVDEKFNGTKFPDRLQLVLNQFELDFVKLIKRGQNAHGVYFIGEDDKLNKQEGQESEFLQEYTEMMGENKLILIKEKQENTGEFFRITGRVEVGTDQVDIDIIPIFKAQSRHKRSLTEPVYRKINIDSKISFSADKNVPPNFIQKNDLEALRKNIISKNLNAKKLAKSGEPVELDVEVLVVTDVSVYLAHKAFLKTTSQSLVLDYMKIYYSHVINNVNKLFKNSFSDDADLRINIKATNFLFLTRQSDSQWSNQSFVGDPRISLYKRKRVILGSRALEIFKNSMDGVQLNFDHALAFVNHDIWYDSDVSNSYTTRSSATGFSYSSGVCSQYKYSIVEDFGAFTNIPITAHHLARNLGASFDSSTDINCLSDQYYIMSPLLKSSSTKFKHRFSECSINELKRILISNGQASTAGQCLANKAVAQNLVSRKNNLTGLFYSANDQCKMLYGHNASFVQYFSDRMCRELYCRKTNMDYYAYTSGPAAEGTVCDSGKICQNGACVSSVLVESNECPFADEPVQNVFSSIRLPTAHVSCSEYFGYLNRAGISISSFCTSSYSYSCCRSCLPYKVSQCLDTNFYCPYYRRFCNFFTYSGDKIADICPLTCSNCPPVSCQTGQAICLNGGTCVVKSNSELSCQCPQGYTGPVCENKNPCTPNPCQNGASCQPAGETAYICQCPSFFIGDDCSILNITISTTSFPSSDPSTRPVSTPSTTRQSQSSTPTQTRFSSTSSSTQQASSSSIPSTSQSVQPIPGVTNIGRTCMFGQNFSFCDVCGRQFADANVKIVGGVDANRNSWPSIGLLVFDYTTTYNFQGTMYRISRQSYCGSTLIDRNTVLTAAHCYISSIFVQQIGVTINLEDDPNFPANAFKVYLGLHSIQGVFEGTADLTGVTVVPVTKFTMHENYNDDTFDNDIAVLKLEREVALNSGVQPACLPPNTDYQPNTNTRAWIAGWGTLSSGGQTPNILQNTFITYYHSGLECNNLGSLNFDKQICAGEIQGGRDTCQGDSGGPLYLFEDNTFVQAGITSFGVDCALAGYPGVYTRVAAYLDWILNNM